MRWGLDELIVYRRYMLDMRREGAEVVAIVVEGTSRRSGREGKHGICGFIR
jgi:hypothetical protein